MSNRASNVFNENSQISQNIISVQKDISEIKITKEILVEKFGKLDANITKYDNLSMSVEITNQDQLKVNETHISTINKFINDIERVRKVFKDPYLKAGKKIDLYARDLSTSFVNSKKRLELAVSSFKQIEVARLKAEEEAKIKAAEALLNEKNEEIEKLRRIRQQIVARIYGGSFALKSGEVKTTAGCISSKDCEDLKVFIKEKFPKSDTFKYLSQESEELLKECIKMLTEHWANVIGTESPDEKVRFQAQENIKEANYKAKARSSDVISEANKEITKEFNKESRSISKEIRDVGKGLRTTIAFKVVSSEDVPIDMKDVSETKVNNYIRINRERILEMLKRNEQPIKGIHVYIEKNFVSR